MIDYNDPITDEEPDLVIGPLPFIISAVLWGIILGVAWALWP